MMFYVQHGTAYGHYLMQYPADAKWRPNGWVWSLNREDGKRFKTKEDAEQEVKQAQIEMNNTFAYSIREDK